MGDGWREPVIGKKQRGQEELFLYCKLGDLVPEEHILKRVGRVIDLSWLRDEVRECYCAENGRPGIDPEAALRLMLAGYLLGIVHDRELMREAAVNIAIRWFAGYRLQEALPDHSSLTRVRQRWGAEKFRAVMLRVVGQCVKAGIVGGKTIHCDATLIRADVSWESLTTQYVDKVVAENSAEEEPDGDPPEGGENGRCEGVEGQGVSEGESDAAGGADAEPTARAVETRGRPVRRAKARKQAKKRSRTDPDATLSTNDKRARMEPCYKQHTAVDDLAGVIVDVEVTTGEVSEGRQLLNQVGRVEEATGVRAETVTADTGYAGSGNYSDLEALEVEAIIPPQREGRRRDNPRMPLRRFAFDARHDVVRCPEGKRLVRSGRNTAGGGWHYKARTADCAGCELRQRCVPSSSRSRVVMITDGYASLLRARRGRGAWTAREMELYDRHRWRVEGAHGEAKTRHGLRRAARRGLDNVAIQAYLTAVAMNLKRLAALLRVIFRAIGGLLRPTTARKSPSAGGIVQIPFSIPIRSKAA